MKIRALSAAAIIAFSATGAFASENICGFNANQLDNGFTESTVTTTETVTRTIGNGSRCQDATIKTSVTSCFNRSGALMDTRTVTAILEESDWGPSYSC